MTITVATTIHYVGDMDRALDFYRQSLELTVTSQSPGWSTLRLTDGCELALHIAEPKAPPPHPFDALETTLSLSVDDLEACVARITANGGEHVRTMEPRPGIPVRMALVRDTEGIGFQINQYVGESP